MHMRDKPPHDMPKALRVGDPVPPYVRPPLFDERRRLDGEAWYCLKVFPQREAAAKAWLGRRHVHAVYPVKEVVSFVKGRRMARETRFLPGLIFARFSHAPVWHNLLPSPFIYDAIRLHTGEPGRLHPSSIGPILDMRSMAEKLDDKMRAAKAIRAGSRVKMRSGPFDGQEVEVVWVGDGRARFKLTLFGGEVKGEAAVENLEKSEG